MNARTTCPVCTMEIHVDDNTGHSHGCPNGDNPGHSLDLGPCGECGWLHGAHDSACRTHAQEHARRRAARGY